MILSEKIVTFRKKAGLSQADLADKLGISRQAVCKWESGESAPDIGNLKQLSIIFNVSLDVLLNDKADATPRRALGSRGEVIRTARMPEVVDVEAINSKKSPIEKRHLLIRKITVTTLFVLIWVFLAALIIYAFYWMLEGDPYDSTPFVIIMVLLGLCGGSALGWWLSKKYLFDFDRVGMREYYKEMKAREEAAMAAEELTAIQLQDDLPVWFFHDAKRATVGFWFVGAKQLCCPLQNVASFDFTVSDTSYTYTERELGGAPIIGGGGFVVTSQKNLVVIPNETFQCVLNYYDNDGGIAEYAFELTTLRNYLHRAYDGHAETLTAEKGKFTRTALAKIKTLIELERARLS
ncbi:MAG: helix-turn-helix domain-containing protein [Clostridia bacterium]|nr:helix-turn-helix domain-containing protein [Clostridia bacterium]